MKKIIAFILAFSMLFCINAMAFTDVSGEGETAKAINKLVTAGIVGGYEDGTFRPNNTLTRAELCKMINLVFEYSDKAQSQFIDVKSENWFYDYALVAKQAGYIGGFEDGTFRGNGSLTKEQFCIIIDRCAGLYELPVEVKITDKVSDWARQSVNKVLQNGLMKVGTDGVFKATQNITRGEVAQVLALYVTVKEDTDTTPPGDGGGSSQPEDETIKAIQNVLTALDKISFTADELKVINPIKQGMTYALRDYKNGININKDYIQTTYGNLVQEAKTAYYSLNEFDQGQLNGKLLNNIDAKSVQYLLDFFDIDY